MGKKTVFVIFVIFVIIAAGGGGFFLWQQGREVKGTAEDYVVVEKADGTYVENKKAGLSVKVPESWEVERVRIGEGWAMFYSNETDIKLNQEGIVILPLKKGCLIEAGILYKNISLSELESDARYSLGTLGLNFIDVEEIVVKSSPALKITFDTQKVGSGVIVNIPRNDKVYLFNLSFGSDDKEMCSKDFDNFLETASF